jgi:hypothetical protein
MREKSPPYHLKIGAASLIPGLGFWLINDRDRAVQWGALIFGLIGVSLIFPAGSLTGLTFTIAYVLWLIQIGLAVRAAKTSVHPPSAPMDPSDNVTGASYYERDLAEDNAARQMAREVARAQLDPGERLIKALVGKNISEAGDETSQEDPSLAFLSPWYCVALTQVNLVIIALDNLWKPVDVTRGSFRGGVKTTYQKGWLSDEVTIAVPGAAELNLEVSDRYRKELLVIIEVVTWRE